MINPLPDKLGTSDVWVEDIGKRVKVRAQVVDNKELTIIGAEGLYVLKINTASDNPADWNIHQGRGYQISYPKNATIAADNSTDKIYQNDLLIISIKNAKTESETIQEYAQEYAGKSVTAGFARLNGNTAMYYYYNDQPDLVVSNTVYYLINDRTLYTIVLPVLEEQNKTTQQQILDTFTFANELACTQNSECVLYGTDTCCGIGAINKDFLEFRPKYSQICERECPNEKISAVCKSNTCVLE